jgi:hypothetical protein
MSTLDTEDRQELRDSDFAYIDSEGERHLPVHDESHARNAVQRFSQTEFESASAKKDAAEKVLRAARKHGVDVSDDSDVAEAARG